MSKSKKIVLKLNLIIANGKNKGKKAIYIEYADGSFSYTE